MRTTLRAGMLLLWALTAVTASADDERTLLLRQPTLSDTHIAFVYAGDLWIARQDGSEPRRLTSDPADERTPHFSPDGSLIAFTAEYGGNTDVYVMPAAGGTPRRLTFHPGADEVTGWSADGGRVTFTSAREVGNGRSGQLYEVGIDGGLPRKVMEAPYFRGAWHGDELAYMPFGPAYNGLYGGGAGWRGYRGGTTPFIWIIDPVRESLEQVPRPASGERVNDIAPMWDDGRLYFLSDRHDKVFNVHGYDRATGTVERLTDETDWDVRSAAVRNGRVVYEAGGRLKTLDIARGDVRELVIRLAPDLPQTRPQWKDASRTVETARLSATGKRVLFTARGEVFSVPTKHGSPRNLSGTDAVREYSALWSPDGERVAWVADDEGRQSLRVTDQAGLQTPRDYPLGDGYHQLLDWSGDGRHIVYADSRLTLWVIGLERGSIRRIATHVRRSQFDVATSGDGRWVAFTLAGANFLRDLMLYDLNSGSVTRVTEGMADVASPAFSRDGKYLYFGASTNSGPTRVTLDLSSQERPQRLALYAAVLAADGESPLAPRTGDETADAENDRGEDEQSDAAKAPPPTRIDTDGLADRLVALPVAERNYAALAVDKDGNLLYIDQVQPGASDEPAGQRPQAGNTLMRFDFEERKADKLADGVVALTLSGDGGHLLVRTADGDYQSAAADKEPKLEKVDLSGLRVFVDPRREWAQIFADTWRMQREFFYAENMHGVDWQSVYDKYRPLLDHVGRREDLNDLLVQLIAELQVGHNRVVGGDVYRPEPEVKPGLLGADLRIDQGRHRIARILTGERWNPFLAAPLARPGLGIAEGDYLLAVNGRPLGADDNVFEHLLGTAGRQITLSVARRADGRDARDVVVEPVEDERRLRLWNWVEQKRRRVDQAAGGRVGYVYLPNTTTDGYTFFNRMFFAQVDRPGLIVDERSNGGGQAANYVTDVLGRTYLAGWRDRHGLVFNTPGGAVYGPKVMLIDQDAGSGGDFLPYAFRHEGLGPLIGTRTWGGLIGISVNPPLMDGGSLVVPFFRFFTPDGEWRIENEGVAPDIDVPLDPLAFNRGEDVQLERAIREVLSALESYQPIDRKVAPPLPTELGR
jgi:tricorn protease